MENICKFSSATGGDQELFSFQFVYETHPEDLPLPQSRAYSFFCCHLVTEGTAVLKTGSGSWKLSSGDMFFAFPTVKFELLDQKNFRYLYISFIGHKLPAMLEGIGVTQEQPVCRGMDELLEFWFDSLQMCTSRNLSFMAKGVLYCTFARLQGELCEIEKERQGIEDVVAEIRATVEREYANPDLSLEIFALQYRYNVNYLSRRFRELTSVTFLDYLTTCRMRHATVLLRENGSTVREVAMAVGYKDALYFSKVYKKRMGVAPKKFNSI